MSGTLDLNDQDTWMPAGWVFDNVLAQLGDELSASSPELARILREGITESSGGYVNLDIVSAEQLRGLLAALEIVRARTLAQGRSSFHVPEFFEGYIEQLNSLIEMVRRDERVAAP